MKNEEKKKIRQIYLTIRDTLFPSRCFLCGELLLFQSNLGSDICNSCFSSLSIIQGKRCTQCSLPLISEQETCLRCRDRSYHFTKHFSLFRYKGQIKELVYYYKFKQKHSLGRLFSHYISEAIIKHFPGLPIIPVPSRKGLLFSQKRDHLAPIINRLKKNYKMKILPCLKRTGDIPQKKLSFNERLKNLHGQISCNTHSLSGIKEVILFDDIFTTGATANECARVLKNAGIPRIYSFSFAID